MFGLTKRIFIALHRIVADYGTLVQVGYFIVPKKVEIAARWCDYRLFFVWQGAVSAMQFSCQFDMKVQSPRRTQLNDLLAEVNTKMWLGHFDLCSEESAPMFRHTILLRGTGGVAVEQLEDLMEAALCECERYYPAFQFVIWGGKRPEEAMQAAMLETVGEA